VTGARLSWPKMHIRSKTALKLYPEPQDYPFTFPQARHLAKQANVGRPWPHADEAPLRHIYNNRLQYQRAVPCARLVWPRTRQRPGFPGTVRRRSPGEEQETCLGQASLHNWVDDGGRPPGNQRAGICSQPGVTGGVGHCFPGNLIVRDPNWKADLPLIYPEYSTEDNTGGRRLAQPAVA
jgi:hypothetical protein